MTVIELASTMEGLYIEIKEINSLLQLYDEHREAEFHNVSLDEPYTVEALLSRQHLGLALLRAIEDKARNIQKAAKKATDEAYKTARASKAPAPKVQ